MKKALIELIDRLKEDDLKALSYLYLYRAMDVEQVMKYVYLVDTETPAGKRKRTVIRNRLMAESLVTVSVYHNGREAMQITNKGIEVVRHTRDIPNEVFDQDKKVVKRGYYTQADLALNTRLVNHQVHLNQFMLDFETRARAMGLPWNYRDEKFLSSYVNIRPDGMVTLLDHDLFIETDMATESKAQLIEKWAHYRAFLNTDEFRLKSRKIVVLFVTDNIISKTKIRNRMELVKQTIVDTFLDEIKPDFEIVVKPRDAMLDYVFSSLIPSILNQNRRENQFLQYLQKKGFTLSYGYHLNQHLLGDFYQYYVRKLDEDGKIISRQGTPQEYFVDFYLNEELSVLHRIEYFKRNDRLYRDKFGRGTNLIIVTDNVEQLYKDLDKLGPRALGQQGIFVVDLNTMSSRNEVYQNLLQLSQQGEVFRTVSSDHSRREYLYTLGEKEVREKAGRVTRLGKKK